MTGSRDEITEQARDSFIEFLSEHDVTEGHHGDCKGADAEIHRILSFFHEIENTTKIKIIIHPPSYEGYRAFCKTRTGDEIRDPKDFLDRNHDIVDQSDFLVAFPDSEKETLRSGTWATVRYARKKKKTIYIFLPDGKIVQN